MTEKNDNGQYWATLPPDELARRCMDKVTAYRRWFAASGNAEKARRGWKYANGWSDNGGSSSRLQRGGESGDLVKMVVNGVRPLLKRTASMVLSGAPEMVPIAANSDSAAREQVDLSKGVEENITRVHRVKQRNRKALNAAMQMGEAFLVQEWDGGAGKVTGTRPVVLEDGSSELNPDGSLKQQPAQWEGDFRMWLASAFDLYRDTGLTDFDDASWIIVRRRMSKWKLAAKYPELSEEISALTGSREADDDYFDLSLSQEMGKESDFIDEFIFWHEDAPELPGGREFRFLSAELWVDDGAYPYEPGLFPAQRLAPDEVALTSLGYATIFDALGISDMLNAIVSGMSTNVTTGAVPPLLNFSQSGMTSGGKVGTGHKVLNVSKPELAPKFMESPQTPPEAYKLMETLQRWLIESQGLNETSMGRPPFSGMAAQAMALLDAKSDEYQDSLRDSYLGFLANTATFRMRVLKRYAKEERLALVAGKSKRWILKRFTGDGLSLVDSFHVEPVNVASRSLSGRLGLMETMNNFGVPLRPEQIVEMFRTGQYESDFDSILATRYGLREENEALQDGSKEHMPLMTDKHWDHIQEHLSLIDSPEARENPDMVQRVLSAVQVHLEMWRSMPPDLLALRGGPPPPMPVVVPGAPGMPGAPPSGAADDAPAQVPDAAAPAAEALAVDNQQQPNLPSPPQGPAQ